jgi:hypothetical protein
VLKVTLVIMRYTFWKSLSAINKVLLPKIFKKPDLMKLTYFDKAIVGWKMFVTYKFLDASKSKGHNVI